MNTTEPDLSPLLPDDATVNARRAALVDAVGSGAPSPQPTPSRRRRASRLALGGSVALTAVAAALIVSAGSDKTPKAFAVEPQDGGGVTIKVYSPEDAAGLEAALASAGIRSQVTWLPTGMTCREPRFTPSNVRSPLGGAFGGVGNLAGPGKAMTIGLVSSQQWHERREEYLRGEITAAEYASPANLLLDPSSFGPDQTLVISGSRGPYGGDSEGGFETRIGIAEGPVEPCAPISQPDGGVLGAMNRAVGAESGQHAAEATASGTSSGAAAAAAAALRASGSVGG